MKNEFDLEIEITQRTDIKKWNRTPKLGGLWSEVLTKLKIKTDDFLKTMKGYLDQLNR